MTKPGTYEIYLGMKKLYSVICAAIMAVGISFSAQATAADIEGVVGMNFSTIDQSGVGFRPGFHAGVRATFYIPDVVQGFYVNGAALLSLKGYKTDSINFKPFFLDIPVHAGYVYMLDERASMFIEAGPYAGIGLFGKCNGDDIFSDKVGYKRFDFGLGVRGGVVLMQRYTVSLGADFGFLKVIDGASTKPRNIQLSFGCKF